MRTRSDGLMLIGLYHLVCGFLNLVGMCAIVFVPFVIGMAAVASTDPDAGFATAIVGVIGMIIGGVVLLIAIANLVIGWGLLRSREWARLGALGLAIFRLLNIPLGTVIGGIIIWYLLREDVKQEFTS